jgi:5'-methylthioadenosine phosphorylase
VITNKDKIRWIMALFMGLLILGTTFVTITNSHNASSLFVLTTENVGVDHTTVHYHPYWRFGFMIYQFPGVWNSELQNFFIRNAICGQIGFNSNGEDTARIGVIGGTGLFGTTLFEGVEEKEVETKYGSVYLLFTTLCSREVVFIPRHGKSRSIPPHMINHKANMMALKELGVEKVIGISTVGSLKPDIKIRSLVVPNDYINLYKIPTFYDDKLVYITPELDEDLRDAIIRAAKELGMDPVEEGVYIQIVGPRLETKAETNFLDDYADVVGMDMASEATLAKELGLCYASINVVTDYANGLIEGETLKYEETVENASRTLTDVETVLMKVIELIH